MARGRKKKLEFEELDSEFKDTIASLSDEQIKQRMAEIAMNEQENQNAKKADTDLEEKIAQAKYAGEVYKEATKFNRLRTKYCCEIINARKGS